MRILFFGAGPLGSVYAHLLHEKGGDVTVLARGERYEWLRENSLVLVVTPFAEEGRKYATLRPAADPRSHTE